MVSQEFRVFLDGLETFQMVWGGLLFKKLSDQTVKDNREDDNDFQ